MKIKKKKKLFVPGCKVYVINEPVWGMVPMTVISVTSGLELYSYEAKCSHPQLGYGYFLTSNLVHANPTRQAELSQLQYAIDLVARLQKKLFII